MPTVSDTTWVGGGALDDEDQFPYTGLDEDDWMDPDDAPPGEEGYDHVRIHRNLHRFAIYAETLMGVGGANITSPANAVLVTGNQTVAGIKTLSSAPIFSSLTGYLKANGASALTAAATVPEADISPDGSIYVRKTTAQTITGAKTFDAGTLLDKGNHLYSVAAYGGAGDGVTDNTTAINAAIADMPASGGCLYFGPGDWRYGTAISTAKNVWVLGAGRAVTFIKCTFATGDAITLSGASVVIEKVSLQSTVNRTSGAVLKITGGCTLDQMNVENNFFTAIHLAGNGYLLRNCYVGSPGSASGATGVLVSQGSAIAITDDTVINMTGGHATRYTLRVDACGDIALSDSHFLAGAYGLYAAPTSDGVYSLFAVNCHFDGNTTRGVLLKPGAGGVIRRVQFVNCASTSNGGTGIEIDNNGGTFTGSVELVGHRSYGNTGDGLLVSKTSGALPTVNVVGGSYTDPTIPNSGVDIHISANVDNFHLSDFIADDLTVEAGTSNNYTIEPRALTTLTDGGTGTAKRVYRSATARLGLGVSPDAGLHLGGTNRLRFGTTAGDEYFDIYRFGDGILYFDGEQASFAGFKFRTDQGGTLTDVLALAVNGVITIPNLTPSKWVKTDGSKALVSADLVEDDVAADGTTFVALTGAQTVAGVKTLSSAPILSALTASRYVGTDGSKALVSVTAIEIVDDILTTNGNFLYRNHSGTVTQMPWNAATDLLRVTGVANVGSGAAAAEVGYTGSAALYQGYDRNGAVYVPMRINASKITMELGAIPRKHIATAVTLTNATATTIGTLVVPNDSYVSGQVQVACFSTNGTDHQITSDWIWFAITTKGGTAVAAIARHGGTADEAETTAITQSLTPTAVVTGTSVEIKLNYNVSAGITPSTLKAFLQWSFNTDKADWTFTPA